MILLVADPSLAAKKRRHDALPSRGSTLKNRVWGFESIPSGLTCSGPGSSWENAAGCVQYSYKNASGRTEFLQTDPLLWALYNQGPNLYAYCENDCLNAIDPTGLTTLLVIHRDPPSPGQDPRNAPGTMDIFHDGEYQGSTRVNENGYQDGSNGIYPGTYNVEPRDDYQPGDNFPNGPPAITVPGQTTPGDAGHGYHNVYVHGTSGKDGPPDSRGCVTTNDADKIKKDMDEDRSRGEPTTLKVFNNAGGVQATPVR